ncbi:MFS transporter [Rhodococcus rhodnii]|uniref:Major facilitator superfamily multidrug n=2 Tax=Rhodococcus rhodnii TaxID=38312 RepID=R7WJ46_9NOCA|nr:MFS transporter [Rhodococcus rhodnii]EOM75285.1 major facilitator superfamily multidrug [Rhodococcus rhodnii LMG 5362]TXG92083.1 MFS transporter [Rhodococcus rhodnii]
MTSARRKRAVVLVEDTGTPPALAALLTGTFVGTVSNGVVNVPLSDILSDFDAPLGSGILVVVGFLLTFSATMPLAGYVGDRFGRRRIYCGALLVTAVCSVGAATAPSLEVLVAWRALAGLAAAAFAPAVMGLIAWLFGPSRRARAVGAWASVNGIGQAVGPSAGGLLADAVGWRWVFVPLVPVALLGFALTMRYVPQSPKLMVKLDAVGATTMTAGAATAILGVTLLGSATTAGWTAPAALCSSVVLLTYAIVHCSRVRVPFVDMRAVAEPRFARSAVASFAQMFALGATLLAVPLFLVTGGTSTGVAGVLLVALPVTMALLAPVVGHFSDRIGPRLVLRAGLTTIALAQVLLAVISGVTDRLVWIAGALVLAGVGVAMVQTPAATGSTRSAAGQQGSALGLFNLMRFGGSAVGAAWVSVALHHWDYPILFSAAATVAVLGLLASFVGTDPEKRSRAQPALEYQR